MTEIDYEKYFNDADHRNDKMKKKNNKSRTWLISVISVLVIFGIFAALVYSGLPSLEELKNPKPQLASKVFSADGELIGQYFIENRIETNIDSLPDHLINALIATEDRQF